MTKANNKKLVMIKQWDSGNYADIFLKDGKDTTECYWHLKRYQNLNWECLSSFQTTSKCFGIQSN